MAAKKAQRDYAAYFVDEAGDLSLFNKRGEALMGRQGVSDFFMIGFADIPNPRQIDSRLRALREGLLADPYFQGVPSMQPDANKTAIDYYLWALQRMYERGEARFFELLRSNYALVWDMDDTRRKAYGEYYDRRNPLKLERIKDPQTD